MKTLSERLRGPIKHPQQLMSQRIEAADVIDELVNALEYFVECEASNLEVTYLLRDKYPHIMKKYLVELTDVNKARELIAKHKGEK